MAAAPQLAQPLWTRRRWCVHLALGLLLLGAILNILYLFNHCPIELSEDEAHYWLWAHHLDYGYYSKPPGIAWVIAAAEWVGGRLGPNGDGSGSALMPVLRMPAVLFGFLSGLLSFSLARRMFRDDRVGLAVILLSAAVPMFAVGSLLITIDSPMYLCWAATIYCLWRCVEARLYSGRSVGWLYLAGLTAAVGMLFKPVLIAIPLCAALGAWRNPMLRRAFKTPHALGAVLIMLLSQIPVILWNANHGWVTFRHIATQGGLGQQAGAAGAKVTTLNKFLLDPLSRVGSFLGGQAGGMGGLIFLLLLLAVIVAVRQLRSSRSAEKSSPMPTADHWPLASEHNARLSFLLWFTLPLWLFYFFMNFWKGTEVNWPAASYFTGMILLAGIVVQMWNAKDLKDRRNWRGWTTATILWGVLLTALALNLHRVYPFLARKLQPLDKTPAAYDKSPWNPRKWDPSAGKLRGMQARADALVAIINQMRRPDGTDPLLIAGRYDTASSLSFYLPNHPFVYCIMSSIGGRQSQFDLWPGLSQKVYSSLGERYAFAGRDALLIGMELDDPNVGPLLRAAFESIGPKEVLSINYAGITVKRVTFYRAFGFRVPPEKKGVIF